MNGDTSATLAYTGRVYNNAHVASATTVIVSGLSISSITGSNSSVASDYVLDASSKIVSAAITAKTLTPTITNTGVTKVYDGTEGSSIIPTYSFSGFISNDTNATLAYVGRYYNNIHVASATTVTVSGLSISSITGSNSSVASDYALDASSKTVSAVITAKIKQLEPA